jgi:hypothetical protein
MIDESAFFIIKLKPGASPVWPLAQRGLPRSLLKDK